MQKNDASCKPGIRSFLTTMAAYIKGIDSNHMVQLLASARIAHVGAAQSSGNQLGHAYGTNWNTQAHAAPFERAAAGGSLTVPCHCPESCLFLLQRH